MCWHPPIVPGRRQPSIVGTSELNFRVRDGNGCTLTVINTNLSQRLRLCSVEYYLVGLNNRHFGYAETDNIRAKTYLEGLEN